MLTRCLKRSPLVSFPRFYASAAIAHDPTVKKKRAPRKPKVDADPASPPPSVRVEPAHPPSRSPKIEAHLDEVAATNGQLQFQDIERYRAQLTAYPGTERYKAEYEAVVAKLTASFNVKQLRHFLDLYGVSMPPSTKKLDCAWAIIEKGWELPSLATLEESQRERVKDVQTFPLTPSQAFFVLGKDGSQYRALSSKYSVHMEYLRNPLSLRVEGQIGSLKKLSKHIVELKAALVEDVFELPIDKPIRVDLLKRISQLSGAFTENFGPGKVRIVFSSNNPRTALVAQRLATRAVCEGNDDTRLFLHLPPSVPSSSPLPPSAIFPHSYSLYPFLSPRSLPWTVSAGGVFRLRRVEDWLSTGASEDLQKTGGLLMGRGRTVTQQQQDVDLRTLLEENSPESSSSTSRVLTASIGHILVTTPSSNQITILPPLAGHHKLPHILEWIEKQTEPTLFTPTLPTALLSLQPNHHRMLHRLIYRALQSANDAPKTIRMELDIPRSVPANEDAGLAEPVLRPRCWVGKNIDLDVMMPDRPADIRFSIFDSVYLSPQEMPSTLEEYATDLQAFLSYQDRDASQPETPLTVVHEGLTYILLSSSTVRQNMEEDTGASRPVRVVTESILDLEGDQKSASCQVICEDVVTDAAWKSFMGHCDVMSTMQATTTRTAL